ncbi:MAG: PAS domain-containing protein [Anaerolineae bacterium]|nr:PAS domain-containing protein [Anaerolineae bacterium]
MAAPTRLLIVTDQRHDPDVISEALRQSRLDVEYLSAAGEQEFIAALERRPDAILARYQVGDFGALHALGLLHRLAPHTPFLVFDNDMNAAASEACVQLGAFAVIPADQTAQLVAALRRALQAPLEMHLVPLAADETPRNAPPCQPPDRAGFFFYRLRLTPDRALERIDGDCQAITGYTVQEFQADPALLLAVLNLGETDLAAPSASRRWAFRLRARNGSAFDVEHFTNVLPGESDQPAALEGLVRDVTAHLHTAATLQRSEANFRAAAEGSLDAFYILSGVLDEAGQIIDFVFAYANARAESTFYLSRERLLGQRIGELFPVLRAAGFLDRYAHVMQTGQPFEGEFFLPESGQIPGWYYQQVTPLEGGVFVVNRDITSRKLLEASLRRSGNMFRWFVARSIDGVMLADELGVLIAWNEAQEQITGLPRQEVIGRFAWDVIRRMLPPERARQGLGDDIQARLVEALRTGEGAWLNRLVETEVIRPDGSRRVIQEAYFPLRTDKGYMIGNIARDITERRRMEEAMSATAANLRAMLNNGSQAFVLLDRDGLIQAHNDIVIERARPLFGKAFQLGKPIYDVLPDAARIIFRDAFPRVLRGESHRQEMGLVADDDGTYWFRIDFTPVATEEGRIIGACISALDITEQRDAEKRRLDLVIEREKVQVLESFINDASHDFRTPISILKTTSYLLGKYSDQLSAHSIRLGGQLFTISPETLSALLHDIGEIAIGIQNQVGSLEAGSQRLERLVESLLEITRLEHQRQFALEPHSLNVLADGVVEMYRPLAVEQQITLHFSADGGLPVVLLDEEEFGRVIQNLLENALNFTPQGGQVTIRTYRQGNEAVLDVSDTGIGIAPADLPHIFERFYRADKARQTYSGGAGLGLSIARRIVEAHGGRIEVSSALGVGSAFRVLLPLGKG